MSDSPIGTTTNEETLNALRETFKYHEHLPVISLVHVEAMVITPEKENATMLLCIHDDANEMTYGMHYPLDHAHGGTDGEVNEGVKRHVGRIVSAAWN